MHFLDALNPEQRDELRGHPDGAAARLAAAQASPDYAFAPPDPSIFGLSGEDHAWVARRQVPHPGHTYDAPLSFDPARVAAVPRTFIDCTQPPLATIDASRQRVRDPRFWGGLWAAGAGAHVVEMATGHDPMISAPGELADLLLHAAA